MIKDSFYKLIYVFIFIIFFAENAFTKIETLIIYKINDQIITNVDLDNEKKFLLFLNPNLNNLSKDQIKIISQNSLKNRKIKEIELTKFFDFDKENFGNAYIKQFISNSKFETEEALLERLKEFNLPFNLFSKKVIIDNLWREFIFNKFKSQIKIDEKKLKEQIESMKNEVEELNLSEILFELKPDISLENLKKDIYGEIEKSGFEAAASIYSISDSKNFGGNIGWVRSNQISNNIYLKINKKKISDPIKTNNGYLIIKVNDKRKITEKINPDQEFLNLVNLETEKQLNKIGYIYFNKIKKRTFVSEN